MMQSRAESRSARSRPVYPGPDTGRVVTGSLSSIPIADLRLSSHERLRSIACGECEFRLFGGGVQFDRPVALFRQRNREPDAVNAAPKSALPRGIAMLGTKTRPDFQSRFTAKPERLWRPQ